MGTVKGPRQHRRDAEAGESVPPRQRLPPVATKTDESVAPCRIASCSDDLCYSDKHEHQSREDEHTYVHHCSIQERCRPWFLCPPKQKVVTGKLCGIVWRGYSPNNDGSCATNLKKNRSNLFQMKLKVTPNETQNG
jgi:hypothetical protein